MSEAVALPCESFEEDGPVVGFNHSVIVSFIGQFYWLLVGSVCTV